MITNLICTIFVYLLVPIIILTTGKQFKKSTLIKITVINGATIYIFFSIINFLSGDETLANIGATFLWSYVGFLILKKRCLKNDDISVVNIAENPIHCADSTPSEMPEKYCKYCGYLIDDTTKQCTGCGKQYFKGFRAYRYSIIISLLLIIISVMLATGTVQYLNAQNQITELQNTILKLEEENSQLEKNLKKIKKYAPNYYVDENGKTIKIH